MSASIQVINGELDLLSLQSTNTLRYPFFLDSAAHGFTHKYNNANKHRLNEDSSDKHKNLNQLGRYSILFAFPQKTLKLDHQWRLQSDSDSSVHTDNFLDALDEFWKQEKIEKNKNYDLPFQGGWFVFLAYELANEVEPVLELQKAHDNPGSGLPIAFATRIPAAVIVDHFDRTTTLFVEAGFEQEFHEILKAITQIEMAKPCSKEQLPVHLNEEPEQQYLDAIKRAQDYIYEGDIFQANLSREWRADFKAPVSACAIYKKLRTTNPAPFSGLVFFEDHVILSSSPERLLKIENKTVSTRPIAGTRPRGDDTDEDKYLRAQLISNVKERAEHIMLIDLERNDLGRICEAGSIEVDELMVIETYEHVHHIVSNIKGVLRQDISPAQAISAVFPGGTITGCPKVRCMQIISELENKPREAYTGSMGYLNHNGDMDLNILIRTMHLHQTQLSFRAGGGIVYDSIPDKEVQETRAKARGMINALSINS